MNMKLMNFCRKAAGSKQGDVSMGNKQGSLQADGDGCGDPQASQQHPHDVTCGCNQSPDGCHSPTAIADGVRLTVDASSPVS
jgi:hypothetical protein